MINIKEIKYRIVENNIVEFFYENKPVTELPAFIVKSLEEKYEIYQLGGSSSLFSYEGLDSSFDMVTTLEKLKFTEQSSDNIVETNTSEYAPVKLNNKMVYTLSKSKTVHGQVIIHFDYKDTVDNGSCTGSYNETDIQLIDSLLKKCPIDVEFNSINIHYYVDIQHNSLEELVEALTTAGFTYYKELGDSLVANNVIQLHNIIMTDVDPNAVQSQVNNQAFGGVGGTVPSLGNNTTNPLAGLFGKTSSTSSTLSTNSTQSPTPLPVQSNSFSDMFKKAAQKQNLASPKQEVPEEQEEQEENVSENVEEYSFKDLNDFIIQMAGDFDESVVESVKQSGQFDLNDCFNVARTTLLCREGKVKMSKMIEFLCKVKKFV